MRKCARALGVILTLAVIMPIFATLMTVNAETVSNGVCPDTDHTLHNSLIDVFEDQFNVPDLKWTVEGCEAQVSATVDKAPYKAFDGSSLVLKADGYAAGTRLKLSCTPAVLTSLDGQKYLTLAIWIPSAAGNVTLGLSLTAGGSTVSLSKTLKSGCWQSVFFDVSRVGSAKVESIGLTLTATSSGNHRFVIDSVGACSDANAIIRATYMTDGLTANGCTLDASDMTVTLSGEEEQYLTAEPVLKTLEDGVGIGIAYENFSDADIMGLTVTAGEEEYYSEARLESGLGEAIFAIPGGRVDSFKISLKGEGRIRLISIKPVGCYTPVKRLGSITEVRLGRDKITISVRGELNEGVSKKYSQARLQLYALPLGAREESVATSGKLVSEIQMSDSFGFTVKLDDSLDGMYKKYAVVIKDGNSLIPICSAGAISNPATLSLSKVSAPTSIKGSSNFGKNYVLDGIAQTAVTVYADELMTLSQSGTAYSSGGRKYYFKTQTVDDLDSKMLGLERDGISVTFVLKLKQPAEAALKAVLCHPSYVGGGCAAFNTETEDGINALRAIVSFLVERYCDGGVTENAVGLVLGTDVNTSGGYGMGGEDLNETVRAYSAAYRVAYYASRSIANGFAVSVGLGGDWDSATSPAAVGDHGAKAFLCAFASCMRDGIDLEWSLSYDVSTESGYAWKDGDVDRTQNAKRITAANLEVLLTFMSGEKMTYNGAERGVLLIETKGRKGIDDPSMLTADYVYTYLKAKGYSMIKAYIPAFDYGDGDTVRYLDTELFEEKTKNAVNLIGKTRFDTLVSRITDFGYRTVDTVRALSELPGGLKGSVVLFEFDKDSDGWLPSVNCLSAEGGITYSGRTGLLRIRLDRAETGVYSGALAVCEKRIDLSHAPYVSLDVSVASLPEGVDSTEVSVAFYSGRSVYVTSATVYSGTVNTVVCDLSDFSGASQCDRIAIYSRGTVAKCEYAPTLLVGELRAYSRTLSGAELERAVLDPDSERGTVTVKTVVTVAAVGAAAVILLILRLLARYVMSRRAGADEQ